MKKFIALALAAAMFVSPLMSTVQAMEPVRAGITSEKEMTEGRRGRYDHRRGGRRHGRRGSSSGAAIGASILGAVIIGGIIAGAKSKKAKQPQMYCDAYGNCWYQ